MVRGQSGGGGNSKWKSIIIWTKKKCVVFVKAFINGGSIYMLCVYFVTLDASGEYND